VIAVAFARQVGEGCDQRRSQASALELLGHAGSNTNISVPLSGWVISTPLIIPAGRPSR